MRILLASLMSSTLIACAGSAPTTRCAEAPPARAPHALPMTIGLTTVYVDDQDVALRIYTEVLGFTKKADVRNGPYRWLTVVSADAPDGAELLLARDDNPAAAAFQQAMFQQGQPAAMFFTDDVAGAYTQMKARGAVFTMPPTEVMAGSIIATLDDGCGNLIQLTQLAR